MTSQKPSTEPPGYRGALPSREDRLARPWILLVIGIFVLVIVLSILGIPSRFINFPDEGHWVLKPRNSQYWHQEVFAWLKKYVPPGPR